MLDFDCEVSWYGKRGPRVFVRLFYLKKAFVEIILLETAASFSKECSRI